MRKLCQRMSRMVCKEFTLEMVLELRLAERDRGVLECWSVDRCDLGGATVSFS